MTEELPEFWFHSKDGKEKKATLQQLIDTGLVSLNQDGYELTSLGRERLRQDEYLRESRTYERDADPELWDDLFELKFYTPSVEGVEIKNVEDYPDPDYDPRFNMTPRQVINFLRYKGYDVNAVRYSRKLERLPLDKYSASFPNPLDDTEGDELMAICKFQALKWVDQLEKIEFEGEATTLYIAAEDKCYSKVIKSGEMLNIPSAYEYNKDRRYVTVIVDCRPNMTATVIDYYGVLKYEEVKLPDGFVECDIP